MAWLEFAAMSSEELEKRMVESAAATAEAQKDKDNLQAQLDKVTLQTQLKTAIAGALDKAAGFRKAYMNRALASSLPSKSTFVRTRLSSNSKTESENHKGRAQMTRIVAWEVWS